MECRLRNPVTSHVVCFDLELEIAAGLPTRKAGGKIGESGG